jgi:hypothetical protein
MAVALRGLLQGVSATSLRQLGVACCVILLSGCGARQTASTAPPALPDWSGSWSADADDPEPRFHTPGSVFLAVRDSMGLPGSAVPFTPKYAALRAAAVSKEGKTPGGALHYCLPSGMPGLMNHGTQFEFLFSPGRITMIFEDGEVRRIYTDGRAHPDKSELYVDVSGHSIGHWEGSTLVVDTVGMHPSAELFLENALKVTRNTHIVERIARTAEGPLQIDTEVSDTEIFSEPYRYMRRYPRVGEATFVVGCTRNNRDTDDHVDLTPPPAG